VFASQLTIITCPD